MAYITETILGHLFDADQVSALVPTGSQAQVIAIAEARAAAAIKAAGYDVAVPPSVYAADASDCPAMITAVAFEEWLRLAYGRKGKMVPTDLKQDKWLVDQLRLGEIELDLDVNTSRGVGGVTTVETSEDVTDADGSTNPVFDRKSMVGFG